MGGEREREREEFYGGYGERMENGKAGRLFSFWRINNVGADVSKI